MVIAVADRAGKILAVFQNAERQALRPVTSESLSTVKN